MGCLENPLGRFGALRASKACALQKKQEKKCLRVHHPASRVWTWTRKGPEERPRFSAALDSSIYIQDKEVEECEIFDKIMKIAPNQVHMAPFGMILHQNRSHMV